MANVEGGEALAGGECLADAVQRSLECVAKEKCNKLKPFLWEEHTNHLKRKA